MQKRRKSLKLHRFPKERPVKKITRRSVLRGVLGGMTVTVGTPVLEACLNTNGTAYANGSPLPVNFGSWFWGLGFNGPWKPRQMGPGITLDGHLSALAPFADSINVFSGMQVFLDGKVLQTHF